MDQTVGELCGEIVGYHFVGAEGSVDNKLPVCYPVGGTFGVPMYLFCSLMGNLRFFARILHDLGKISGIQGMFMPSGT